MDNPEETDVCEVCGSDLTDNYGCMDCFLLAAEVSWDRDEQERHGDQ